MFKRNLNADGFTNLIAEGTEISGNLVFTGVMLINGTFTGNQISSSVKEKKPTDALKIGQTGVVTADSLVATNIIISGTVKAAVIRAEDTVRILKDGKISNATIYYRTLEIEPGTLLHECVLKHLDHCSEGEQT